jgi:hypothetical protein
MKTLSEFNQHQLEQFETEARIQRALAQLDSPEPRECHIHGLGLSDFCDGAVQRRDCDHWTCDSHCDESGDCLLCASPLDEMSEAEMAKAYAEMEAEGVFD